MSMRASTPLDDRTPTPATIEATFRNGSLTAISVVVGFSLSFLNRWAGLPGPWRAVDLVAVALIVFGAAAQIKALADLLPVGSLRIAAYNRAVRIFLVGLGLVAAGVAVALFSDILGVRQQILGG